MTEATPVEFTEDRVPYDGIEEAVSELVDLYGGEIKSSRLNQRDFVLPLRRGVASTAESSALFSGDRTFRETTHRRAVRRKTVSKRRCSASMGLCGIVAAVVK